jgi:hypothetical protein
MRRDGVSHGDLRPSRSTHRPREGRGGHTELPGDLGQRGPERGDGLRGRLKTQRARFPLSTVPGGGVLSCRP